MLNKLLTVALFASITSAAFAATPADRVQSLASQASITPDQVAEIATSLKSPAYFVLYEDGGADHLEFGDGLLKLGDEGDYFVAGALPRGVYWNYSGQSVWLGDGTGTPGVEVPPNGVVVVAARTTASATDRFVLGGGPSVECGAGYYACCCQNNGGSSRTANCIANGSGSNCNNNAACTHGGAGATSCSFGESAAVLDIREPSATNPDAPAASASVE